MTSDHGSSRNSAAPAGAIYFPELDGLRFFAFMLVFVYHHPLSHHVPFLSLVSRTGWIGVDLFFALSAFLFTKLLLAEFDKMGGISFQKFYLRRIFRIWPIYFLYLGFIVSCYFLKVDVMPPDFWARLTGLAVFGDNIVSAISGYSRIPYTGHLWTIAYEEQFYLFIPLIIYLLARSSVRTRVATCITIFVAFNAIRLLMIHQETRHEALWVLPVTHFESIVLGMVVGFGGLETFLKRINPTLWGWLGAVLLVVINGLPSVQEVSYLLSLTYTLVGVCTSLFLFAVLKSEPLKRFFSTDSFVFLGKRSYGLYVYHIFGIKIGESVIAHIPGVPLGTEASFLLSLSFTILVAVLSYKVVEAPFLRLKKKFEVILSRPV